MKMTRVWSRRLGEWTTQLDASPSAMPGFMVHSRDADEAATEASPADAADKESLELLWCEPQADEGMFVRHPRFD